MVRVKRGTVSHKKRKGALKHTKGFQWGRKSKYKAAKEALLHAWTHARVDRKKKKRDFRRLWQIQIGGGLFETELSYSKFISLLKKKKIELNRKILSILAKEKPEIFKKLVEMAEKDN